MQALHFLHLCMRRLCTLLQARMQQHISEEKAMALSSSGNALCDHAAVQKQHCSACATNCEFCLQYGSLDTDDAFQTIMAWLHSQINRVQPAV